MSSTTPHRHSHQSHLHHLQEGASELTPEKMALMKLTSHEIGEDLSRPTSPSPYRRSEFSSIGEALASSSSTAVTRTSSTRRQSGFAGGAAGGSSVSSRKFSAELTQQAEGRFRSLIDVIANASREASSLKSIWEKIIFEREMFAQEREELLSQVTEVTTEMKRRETQHSQHNTEVVERKKQIEKLLIDLSAALGGVAAEKKKVADRDSDLERLRIELRQVRESLTRSTANYERSREELDTLEFRFKNIEDERDTARADSDRHNRDLHRTIREHTETTNKLADVTSKYELSRKEVLSLTDRLKLTEVEREEHIQEIDRLRDDSKKARARAAEASKSQVEVTDRFEKTIREHHKLKEALRTIESERDEQLQVVESLRREVKDHTSGTEEISDRLADVSKKYEAVKREILTTKESLRTVELERKETLDVVERTRETVRTVTRERDELSDELSGINKRADEYRRQVTLISETVRKTEETVTELRSEIVSLQERIALADRERDDAHHHHKHALTDIAGLRERIATLELELRSASESRHRAQSELEQVRREFSEVTETITSYRDDSGEMEFEMESMRTMLREAREQKERAISARNSADRERDDAVMRFEEKCRELERFEESMHAVYHSVRSSAGGEGGGLKASRTITTRTANGGSSSSHHASSGSAHRHSSSGALGASVAEASG